MPGGDAVAWTGAWLVFEARSLPGFAAKPSSIAICQDIEPIRDYLSSGV